MTVAVHFAPTSYAQPDAQRRAQRAQQQQVKTSLGITVTVLLTVPIKLERSAGKACRALDRRNPGSLTQ